MRYGNSVWLGMATMAGVLLCAGATWSEPARSEAACSACNQRVAALEVRVARLEKQMAKLEGRPVGTRPAATPAAPGNAPAAQTVPGTNSVGTFPPVSGCSPPYTVDENGIQRPKAGCEDIRSAPCDPPYVIDAQGVQRPKPECLH